MASVLALFAVTYRLPYFTVAPGAAHSVDEFIELPADRAFPHQGEFLLIDVALREVTPFEALRAWLDRDAEVVPMRELTGEAPSDRARRQFDSGLRQSMKTSQHVAVTVAFGRLGLALPAPEERGVVIDAEDIGGASGGLALTLGLLDSLSRGDLAGDHRVAVTGTIAPSGRVGEVGGVAQKAAAARRAGADYLLVPPGGFNAAVAHAGSRLKVVKVSTLDDALGALARIGGEMGPPR